MRSATDFQEAAKKNDIKRWDVWDCSICDYACGFYFSTDYELVRYDNGCDCTGRNAYHESSWEKVAEHYNLQKNKDVIKKHDQFWGFQNVESFDLDAAMLYEFYYSMKIIHKKYAGKLSDPSILAIYSDCLNAVEYIESRDLRFPERFVNDIRLTTAPRKFYICHECGSHTAAVIKVGDSLVCTNCRFEVVGKQVLTESLHNEL